MSLKSLSLILGRFSEFGWLLLSFNEFGEIHVIFIRESGPTILVRPQGSPLLVKITVNVTLRLGHYDVTLTSL